MRLAARRDAIALRPSKEGQKYPRSARIVRKADFDAVYRNGKRRSSSHFTVFLKANDLPESRFGFSIRDFVIHPKPNVESAAFAALESDLVRLLKV